MTAEGRGDAARAIANAARTLDAEFSLPYLAHAPMEPLNCTMELHSDGAEIWSGCQLQTIDQIVAAQILGFKPEQIKINTLLAGGSFGRRGNPMADWIVELSEIAKGMSSKAPVHLVWTRDDDIKGGFYRPLVLHRVKVGLTESIRSPVGNSKERVSRFFTGTPFERVAVKNGLDASTIEGIVDTADGITDLAIDVHNAKVSIARSVVAFGWAQSHRICDGDDDR